MASPSPVTPPPAPFTERFDSPLNGLSIGYPSGWRTRAATEPWGHDALAFDAPDVNVIFHPTLKEDLYFAVVSEPLGGTSARDWVIDVEGNLPSVGICARAAGMGGRRHVSRRYAWFLGCDTHAGSDDVVIVGTATRGYIIALHVGDGRAERLFMPTYDGDLFGPALETVDLRPEEAVDALSPSASP